MAILVLIQKSGLTKLRKRVKQGDIVVSNTDETEKFSAFNKDAYIKMGMVHFQKNKAIPWEKYLDNQKILNGHCSSWASNLILGSDWGHKERARENIIIHSNSIAPMYLLTKDHKGKEGGLYRTRPVISGAQGMSVHLNNVLSDILEPIDDSMPVVEMSLMSTEDSLNRIDMLNTLIK